MKILDEVIRIWRGNGMDKYAKKADEVQAVKDRIAELEAQLAAYKDLYEQVCNVSTKWVDGDIVATHMWDQTKAKEVDTGMGSDIYEEGLQYLGGINNDH